jgi:hypothetical protein
MQGLLPSAISRGTVRKWLLTAVAFFLATWCGAQTATVKRNVNLRPDPSTDHNPMTTLTPSTRVGLMVPEATNGYFHVTTKDGRSGWVWGRNIRIETGSSVHIGPSQLYPESTKTPGLADTLTVTDLTKRFTEGCKSGKTSCTYSEAHRSVPKSEHIQVYDEYNVADNARNIKHGEVDHFYPLCAGGSNEIANLWYQPAENEWNGANFGFHEKDKLETYVCAQISAGKMNPGDVFNRMTKDWVKFYLDLGLDSSD